MLSIILTAVLTIRPPQLRIAEVHPIRTAAFALTETPQVAFARDGSFEYLGTPAGLMRSRRLLDPTEPLDVIAFETSNISGLAAQGERLYVFVADGHEQTSATHTLLRSNDHAVSFTPIDEKLQECGTAGCTYLAGKLIQFSGNRLFVDAGQNLLVSIDEGASWNVLHGTTVNGQPAAQMCPITFLVAGTRVILGGECPLDAGWLSAGDLGDDGLGWKTPPQPVGSPSLENRNVQFVRRTVDGAVYAGIEGALLKSDDAGATFRPILHYELFGAPAYPYVREFLAPSKYPQMRIAAGFDKASDTAWLAYSSDYGETWLDASFLVNAVPASGIALLSEDSDGRPFIVLRQGDQLTVAELVIAELKAKRCAVAR